MNKAIVIGTYHGREMWLKDCLESLQGVSYPVITVSIPWELNVIKWVYKCTVIDEFLFLQDTVILKNHSWLDYMFSCVNSVSLCEKDFFMYLGKYQRNILNMMDLWGWPEVTNKRQAVTNEGVWTAKYAEMAEHITHFWPLDDTEVYEERHGRLNKVIENDHIIKYKGTWSPEMIK